MNNHSLNNCPICTYDKVVISQKNHTFNIQCPKCGHYKITEEAARMSFDPYGPRYLLSAIVRNRFEQGDKIYLTTDKLKTLKDSMAKPDVLGTIDLLLEHIIRKTSFPGECRNFDLTIDYPLLFAKSKQEFGYYIRNAREKLNYIEPTGNKGYRLTIDGWKRISELRRTPQKTNRAFVAMWFDKQMDDAWENGFFKALDETGFKPIRVDLEKHNEKICNRIIAEIRKSSLIVADFTGHRHNVYFEAGFAKALDINVIWTCKDTDFDTLKNMLDTRQYNHIKWSSPADLKTQLINQIEATIYK